MLYNLQSKSVSLDIQYELKMLKKIIERTILICLTEWHSYLAYGKCMHKNVWSLLYINIV